MTLTVDACRITEARDTDIPPALLAANPKQPVLRLTGGHDRLEIMKEHLRAASGHGGQFQLYYQTENPAFGGAPLYKAVFVVANSSSELPVDAIYDAGLAVNPPSPLLLRSQVADLTSAIVR